MSLPPINIINHNLPLQCIPPNLGQHHCPDNPVHTSGCDNRDANDAVQVVGERLVHAVSIRGRHEGRNGEVDIAEEEEDGDGERGLDRRVPVVLGFVEVEVDEGAGDEDVDDGEGVGDYAGEVSSCSRYAII